jgi:hypothetical protein
MIGGIFALLIRSELRVPRTADRQGRALQPSVHDAWHDHAAALRATGGSFLLSLSMLPFFDND